MIDVTRAKDAFGIIHVTSTLGHRRFLCTPLGNTERVIHGARDFHSTTCFFCLAKKWRLM